MNRTARRDSGFTLIEVVAVMAVIGMLAAILLPALRRDTSRPRLEAYALEVAALLKSDRLQAIRSRREVATRVDADQRAVRSLLSGHEVRIADDVGVEALLPQLCNGSPARSTISFFANGMSCGGVVALTRLQARYEVRVNWFTGGVEIVARDNL